MRDHYLFTYRSNLDRPEEYYRSPEMRRAKCEDWHEQPGCMNPCMFDISPENVVFDEQHLFLRIMDRLEKGIVYDALERDQKTGNGKGTEYVQKLEEAFRLCGVSFKVWRMATDEKKV